MPVLYWDLETRSTNNLRDCGAYVYSVDPTTAPICMYYAVDDDVPLLWLPADPVPTVFAEIAAEPLSWQMVAHNYEFDRAILENVLVPRHGFPSVPHDVQHCSQRLALANAYPAELDLLAQALGLPYRKDPAARKAMLAVSRPRANRKRKPGTIPLWDEDPAKLQLTYARCRLDVITMRAVWKSPKLKHLSESERHFQLQDLTINGRGILLDRAFVTSARDLAIHERTAIGLKLQELTHGTITSADQVKRFLEAINARGHHMTSLSKRAVAEALANRPDDHVGQLLELRRTAARASVNKFKRMLAYAAPSDDRMRGTLRMYGGAPGRWSGLGPQLQNLKKNESNLPLSVVDQVRSGDHAGIAAYGNPLALLGDISRAALCAAPGFELKSGDFSAIESVVLAWLAGEHWKLEAYATFQRTGDTQLEPYKIIARRMLHKPEDAEISPAERQLGKGGELASGFGGSVGAWRRIVPDDARCDDEIKAIISQWRTAHPATTKFWKDLARAVRVAIKTGRPVLVAPAPRPSIVAEFVDGNLTIRLPSGRAITYPEARLVPAKFEDAPSDVHFMDNARGQWKAYRGWFGTFVENVVQGTARDLLAAAIDRLESCSIPVVFHCHDEVTVEVPVGSLSDAEFLKILLELPAWASGLPLGGKVHSGPHYLEEPDQPAEPLPKAEPDGSEDLEAELEQAIDVYLEDMRQDIGMIDDPADLERDDDAEFVADLPDHVAPLTELVGLPLLPGNKVMCPFHEEVEPSCTIYPDHFHCFGCGEHGNRVDWLMRVEGMTAAEAVQMIKEWPPAVEPVMNCDDAGNLALVKSIWTASLPLEGSIAERYLDGTRHIDVTKLPDDVHRCLRFHPACMFGPGPLLPCLIALMRDPVTDELVGIQRTALRERDGQILKIERRMLGRVGVVKLWPASADLVIGEGLETVLAAATRIPHNGQPLTPAWAALSTKNLAALPIVPGVQRLVLLIDNDSNQQGQMSAARVTAHWRRHGRVVVPLMPSTPDTDFNDLVLLKDQNVTA
jgi:DNA polymerase